MVKRTGCTNIGVFLIKLPKPVYKLKELPGTAFDLQYMKARLKKAGKAGTDYPCRYIPLFSVPVFPFHFEKTY